VTDNIYTLNKWLPHKKIPKSDTKDLDPLLPPFSITCIYLSKF